MPDLIALLHRQPPFGIRQAILAAVATLAPVSPDAKPASFGSFVDWNTFVRADAIRAAMKLPALVPEDIARIEAMGADPELAVAFWSEVALRNITATQK